MSETLPAEQLTVLIVTLWAIWSLRCKAIHEEIFQTPFATDNFSKSYLSDIEFMKKKVGTQVTAISRPAMWVPPPADHFKINVDAAVSRSGTFGVVGVICRDAGGLFLGASSLTLRGLRDPQVLETLAIREALALSEDIYLNQVLVASDCKVAIDAIREGSLANFGAIVQEIKMTTTSFSSCNIVHEFRSFNVDAHNLAKHALKLGPGRHVWLGQTDSISFVPVNIVTI